MGSKVVILFIVISFCMGLGAGKLFSNWKVKKIIGNTTNAIACGVAEGLKARSVFSDCATVECEVDVYVDICRRASRAHIRR